ncbi:MAG: hypothetical protein OEW64_02685 [Gammaproteobacteria bacterium]|nr:hypothetical protein [Gammaproteobacteria bacterium]MDH5302985.1 hypothetical protein [Gammaproteobacteria bacterium]MDH5321268.1 hypothetical protein [Gammaproteobacteria bacterium]
MKQLGRSQFTVASVAAALLLGFCSSSVLASSGIRPDCEGVTDDVADPALPAPSLNIVVVDRGPSDATGIQALPTGINAEKIAAPALQDEIELVEDTDAGDALEEAAPVSTPPETALRLHGVAEEDQPHFRRQMYRTDI